MKPPHTRLSRRQLDILEMVGRGISTIVIADIFREKQLVISRERTAIRKITGLDGPVQMAHYCLHHRLIKNNFATPKSKKE